MLSWFRKNIGSSDSTTLHANFGNGLVVVTMSADEAQASAGSSQGGASYAHYNPASNKIHITQDHGGGRSGITHECYYYDEPGQEAFVFSRGREVYITTLGSGSRCIELPSFNKESSDIKYLKLSGISKFQDPKAGFDVEFSYEGAVRLIKKIHIQQLLGQKLEHNSSALVASSSKTVAKVIRLAWTDENKDSWPQMPIDVAVWHPEVSSAQNKEVELEMSDIGTTSSGVVGHVYQDGTFRVTETSKDYPWITNVRPFTGWLCESGGILFLVANHHNKNVVSVVDKDLLIDLPTKLPSTSHVKVSKAYTNDADPDEDQEDESDGIFYINFKGAGRIPMKYDIHELVESKTFTDKYKTKSVRGIWPGYGGSLYLDLHIWQQVDLEYEMDENKKREDSLDNSASYQSDIDGHCYPVNKKIKISTKQEGSLIERRVDSVVPGTYYELPGSDGKEGASAIIAIVNSVASDDSDEAKDAHEKLLVYAAKTYLSLNIKPIDVHDAAEDVVGIVVDRVSEHLARAMKGQTVDMLVTHMKELDIVNSIASHNGLLKFARQNKNRSSNEHARMVGGTTAKKVGEKVSSDIINSYPVGKSIYVMIDRNFKAGKNLNIALDDGYKETRFTDEELHVVYADRTISYNFKELVQSPRAQFMKKHHVLTVDIELYLRLDSFESPRKCMLMVWKDLVVQDNVYDEELDNEMKRECASRLNIAMEDIDVAHLYLQNNALRIINNYDGRGHGPRNVLANGWMVEKEDQKVIILMSEVHFIFVFLTNDGAQQVYSVAKDDFLGKQDTYFPRVKNICLGQSSFKMTYENRYRRGDENPEEVFTMPLNDLVQRCKHLAEEKSARTAPSVS
jgi:hypothetical protein